MAGVDKAIERGRVSDNIAHVGSHTVTSARNSKPKQQHHDSIDERLVVRSYHLWLRKWSSLTSQITRR
jgi:hypothetical protein